MTTKNLGHVKVSTRALEARSLADEMKESGEHELFVNSMRALARKFEAQAEEEELVDDSRIPFGPRWPKTAALRRYCDERGVPWNVL